MRDVIAVSKENKVPAFLLNYWADMAKNDIEPVCKPLKNYGITYFLYVKRFADGSQIELTNHAQWSSHYYSQGYYALGPFEDNMKRYDSATFLWSGLPYQQIYQDLRENFHIDHGITMVIKYDDCNEFFHFAGDRHNHQLMNFYLNHQCVLKRFILYFKDQLEDLIKSAEEKKIVLPKLCSVEDGMLPDPFESLAEEMPINRYFIGKSSHVYITKREAECLKWHILGKTAQEIAMILGISYRTVQVHLENGKHKLNCLKQSQLGYKLADLMNLL